MRSLLVLLAVLSASPSAWATSFYPQPFPEKVQEAAVIVRGKIGMTYTNWSVGPDGGKRIYTFYELSVDEVFKGKAGNGGPTIVIREMGGEKDGLGMRVAGVAEFKRGEDVVVMLGELNADGSHDVRGMMTGKFNIERGEDGKEYLEGVGLMEVIHPALRGHEDALGHGEGHNGTPHENRWSIEGLRQLVRQQQDSPSPAPVSAKAKANPAVDAVTPSPAPAAAPSNSQAPALQPSSSEASGIPGWAIYAGVVVGILLLGGLALLVRKR